MLTILLFQNDQERTKLFTLDIERMKDDLHSIYSKLDVRQQILSLYLYFFVRKMYLFRKSARNYLSSCMKLTVICVRWNCTTVDEVVVYPPDSFEPCTHGLEVIKTKLPRKLLTVVFYLGSKLVLIRYGSVILD